MDIEVKKCFRRDLVCLGLEGKATVCVCVCEYLTKGRSMTAEMRCVKPVSLYLPILFRQNKV